MRYDRGDVLRSPTTTSQGFLRADGYAARVGIYEYRRSDGGMQRELRPPEEVFSPESLASYETASVTLGHPPEQVSADNVQRYEVGTTMGAGRRDGDAVVVDLTVKAKPAIKKIQGGTRQLSPGYSVDLDETPGEDARYASPGNPRGRYDAVQRKIRVNHVAIVERARGGDRMALRMDEAERVDSDDRLTSVVDDHQHTVDLCGDDGTSSYAGRTTDSQHHHAWVRNPDGSVTLAMTLGHTHVVLDETPAPAPGFGGRADEHLDRPAGDIDRGRMPEPATPDIAEQNRLLTVRMDEATAEATRLRADAAAARTESDRLRAENATLKERCDELTSRIESGRLVAESAMVEEQRKRADAADAARAALERSIPDQVRERANILSRVNAVVGGNPLRFDSMPNRDVLIQGIQAMRPKEQISNGVTDEYLRQRFDSLFEDRSRYASSLSRAGGVSVRTDAAPADVNKPKPVAWRDQWQQGAGQFATSRKES